MMYNELTNTILTGDISNQIKSNMFISDNKVHITTTTILNTITGLIKY